MDDYVTKPINLNKLTEALEMSSLIKNKNKKFTGQDVAQNKNKGDEMMAQNPIIDESAIDALRSMDDGDDGFLKEMITIYLEETPPIIKSLQAGLDNKDKELFIRSAHTLRSSSANVGAMALSELGKELETIGKNGGSNNVKEKTNKVVEEYEKVKKALEKYLE